MADEDYREVCSNNKLEGKIFVANKSEPYFRVCEECINANVKDFNELIYKKEQPKQKLNDILTAVREKHNVEKQHDTSAPLSNDALLM